MRKVGMLMVTALAASLLAGCGYKASDKKKKLQSLYLQLRV